LHLDLYKNTVQAPLQGRSRPDFIGLNENDQWLVFESKGRSDCGSGVTMTTLMKKAKKTASLLGLEPIS